MVRRPGIFVALLLLTLAVSHSSHGEDEFPLLEGPYLGQKPPGLAAELFAPGIVSTEYWEAFAAFTPDLNELYFGRGGGKYKEPTLVVIRYENNRWRESFFSLPVGEPPGQPAVSPDGSTFHMGNWYRERTSSGWSEVKNLGAPFEDIPIMRLTASAAGTYVFDEFSEQEDSTIRYSRLINGKYEKPRPLSKEINSGKWTAHPFIAPDESYLIFDSEREDGYGGSDLYVSFRQQDGSWGEAINLGEDINTERDDVCGSVTSDGKYLFFHTYLESGYADIYWADAQVIENARNR